MPENTKPHTHVPEPPPPLPPLPSMQPRAGLRDVRWWTMTGLGTGALPVMPGTWGSAFVVVVYAILAFPPVASAWPLAVVLAGVALVSTVLCVALGGWAERFWGQKDPGAVNLDEFAGQAIALIGLPMATGWATLVVVAATAFVAFRVLDIIKPFPADRLQRLPRGWGIAVDDLIAGVYANILCQLFLRLVVGL